MQLLRYVCSVHILFDIVVNQLDTRDTNHLFYVYVQYILLFQIGDTVTVTFTTQANPAPAEVNYLVIIIYN